MSDRILAIDPGTTRSAIVELTGSTVTYRNTQDNDWVLGFLRGVRGGHGRPLDKPHPTVVIEMVSSYGMRYVGAETYETCVWIGRFIEAMHPLPVHRITRPDVKLHLLGSPRGKDPDVHARLLELVGPKGTKAAPGPTYGIKDDEWSALAVAVTWRDRQEAQAA